MQKILAKVRSLTGGSCAINFISENIVTSFGGGSLRSISKLLFDNTVKKMTQITPLFGPIEPH